MIVCKYCGGLVWDGNKICYHCDNVAGDVNNTLYDNITVENRINVYNILKNR